MIEEILEPENLARAWKRVKANKGAAGIDGMTVGDFPAFWQKEGPRIARALMEGAYRPAPVKRAWIPKPDGTKRPIGIPTVLDRVIQQAIAQVLGPIFEIGFYPAFSGLCSLGFASPRALSRRGSAKAATATGPDAPPTWRSPQWKPAGRKDAAKS